MGLRARCGPFSDLKPRVDYQLSFLGSVSVSLVYPLQRSQQRIHLIA